MFAGDQQVKLRSPYGLPPFHLLITIRKVWDDLPLSSRIIHMAQGGQNSVSTGGQFSVDIPNIWRVPLIGMGAGRYPVAVLTQFSVRVRDPPPRKASGEFP